MVFTIKGLLHWGTRHKQELFSQSEQHSIHIKRDSWTGKEVKQVTQSDIVKETTLGVMQNRF